MKSIVILILTISVMISCGGDSIEVIVEELEGAELGMTVNEVIDILGDPTSVLKVAGVVTEFNYGKCVILFEKGKVVETLCQNLSVTTDVIHSTIQ